MNPFINCKYESISNVLKHFKINADDEILDMFEYEITISGEIIESKPYSESNFEEIMKYHGIYQINIDKSSDILKLIEESIKTDKVLVIKTDSFYQKNRTKYYLKKHSKHNVFVYGYKDGIEIIDNDDRIEKNTYTKQQIEKREIENWYNGYLENFYLTGKDISSTVSIYEKNSERIFPKIKRITDYKKIYKSNINVLEKYINMIDKLDFVKIMHSLVNLYNYKCVDKFRYKTDDISSIIKKQISIINSMKKNVIKENRVKLKLMFKEYIGLENTLIKLLINNSYKVVLRYKDKVVLNASNNIIKINIKSQNSIIEELNNKIGAAINWNYINNSIKYVFADIHDKRLVAGEDYKMESIDDIKEQELLEIINCKLKKIKSTHKLNTVSEMLSYNGYTAEYINKQNNSINGYAYKNEQKYFFKVLGRNEGLEEIRGYLKIYYKLPCSNIAEIIQFEKTYLIIFEYDESINKDKGLLNDFIVERDNDQRISNNDIKIIKNILAEYTRYFNEIEERNNYPMKKFFGKRVESRLINWYNNEELFEYEMNINGKKYKPIKLLIKDTINYFNSNQYIETVLTQGDPNLLNIGIKPIFFDYATSGYNPLMGEISTLMYSTIISDAYICPKYHKQSYYNHEKVLENLHIFAPKIAISINKDKSLITVKVTPYTSKIRKLVLKEYLNIIDKLKITISPDIKYFFVMRILCVFNILEMEEKDGYYLMTLLNIVVKIIDSKSDTLEAIKDIINIFMEGKNENNLFD